jgi:hypothetical protein
MDKSDDYTDMNKSCLSFAKNCASLFEAGMENYFVENTYQYTLSWLSQKLV